MSDQKDISEEFEVLFAMGDMHIPRTDDNATDKVIRLIKDLKPDIFLDGGDIICADCLSTYPKSHHQLTGLQNELKSAKEWMKRINDILPHARKIIIKDNHFWRRLEDRKKGSVWLEDLDAMNAEELMGLDALKWEGMVKFQWKDTLVFIHGDDKNGSQECPVNRARKMVQQTSLSVVRFHSHVTGFEMSRNMGKERCAIRLGCFEDVGANDYMKHPEMSNWTTSAGVFYLSRMTDEFHFIPIVFRNGRFIFNGKAY